MLKDFKNFIKYFQFKDILSKNSQYKNKYLNKRVFILGNGPSLNDIDVSKLKDEYTISVNSFTKTNLFSLIKPKFHVLVDSTRFDDNYPVFKESLIDITKASARPICIFPVIKKDYIEKNDLDKLLDIIYVYPTADLTKINSIDFTKRIPPYQNVVNVALYLAIYLGFTEIYLVGTDMTGFIKTFDKDDSISYGEHFYEGNYTAEKKVMDDLHNGRTNEGLLLAYAKVFKIFRYTNEFARMNGIKIYNASGKGALDVFPRIKFEQLFK